MIEFRTKEGKLGRVDIHWTDRDTCATEEDLLAAGFSKVSDNTCISEDIANKCAEYIFDWLKNRNGSELESAFGNMRVKDAKLMKEELIWILRHGGKPDNWVK